MRVLSAAWAKSPIRPWVSDWNSSWASAHVMCPSLPRGAHQLSSDMAFHGLYQFLGFSLFLHQKSSPFGMQLWMWSSRALLTVSAQGISGRESDLPVATRNILFHIDHKKNPPTALRQYPEVVWGERKWLCFGQKKFRLSGCKLLLPFVLHRLNVHPDQF